MSKGRGARSWYYLPDEWHRPSSVATALRRRVGERPPRGHGDAAPWLQKKANCTTTRRAMRGCVGALVPLIRDSFPGPGLGMKQVPSKSPLNPHSAVRRREGTCSGGKRRSVSGKRVSCGGERMSAGGKRMSAGGKRMSSGGKRMSAGGKRMSAGGKRISSGGKRTSFGGKKTSHGGVRRCPRHQGKARSRLTCRSSATGAGGARADHEKKPRRQPPFAGAPCWAAGGKAGKAVQEWAKAVQERATAAQEGKKLPRNQ